MEWTTACPDWEKRIVAGESLIPPPLFPDVAEVALEVFGNLIVPDMVGRPRMRDVMPPWVMDYVAAIFGALDFETNRRLIKDFLLLISKKNGKSTIAAGIMLTALELNERDMAEAVILAPTKEVADNAFKPAMGMIEFDDEMKLKYTVSAHTRTITHIASKSTLKVLAADDKAAGGAKAAYVLIDELHLFGAMGSAESIITEATGGLMSKTDGFCIKLTTQSTQPPTGVFKTELDYARDVRDGKVADKHYLPVLYEFPQHMLDDEEHLQSKNFYVTNPSLGYSVDEQYLVSQYQKALLKGETEKQEFLAKFLNVEVGLNLRSNRWPGADVWLNYGSSELTLDVLIEQSDVITIGGDGGGSDDLLGMAVVGRHAQTRKWLIWNRAWCTQGALNARKSIAPKLLEMERAGELVIVPQLGPDTAEFGRICKKIHDSGKLNLVGLDPLKLGNLKEGIIAGGLPEELLVGISQGMSLMTYIEALERRLSEGTVIHSAQVLMTWCVSNAKLVKKGRVNLIEKQVAGTAKIDPLMATFNAVGLMLDVPEVVQSVYETRGIRTIG
ncbi:terminase large subunit domain-containing protein [Vitreoscilla sp. C1]|uniref:terminase large subunit domain-containing protein n=1 Tax=Vitreoscilla sp. (strain C1) TaxID=96942 RepID=UPI001C1096D4|nr:terminase large subunit [Vitreoscilla sp. C1]